MTSREIKDVKIKTDGGLVTPKKLIFESSLIFPIPKIQGITIKGLFDFQPTQGWKKAILMSSDGIVKTLSNTTFDGTYTPLANVMGKENILIIEYSYSEGGNYMNWRWPDGTFNEGIDVWADRFYDGHFKVEAYDDYYGLATNSTTDSVGLSEHLTSDQGNYHVVGLYEIETV